MKILLGYVVGSGDPVYLEDGHVVITGMTQLSGKTTSLEALVERGEVVAVTFLTKRGEKGFRNQREIPPYFREQKKGRLIDWQYVEAILEATMGERMKFERSWIIKVCKGAGSLEEVYENIQKEAKSSTRGLDQSIYTNLGAYFEIILPEIKKYNFVSKLKLTKGFNVMNLIGMANEMQQLVIESTLAYVYNNLEDTVIVIPEAHKFIPQGLKTPVKATALQLIKEGATNRNYMWIDTQETTSVDKALLKQCSNWIMGYQQEKNEVKNVRENIGRKKISDEDIMNLKLGHFIASLKQKIYHVYILPAGIDPEVGKAVAMGKISVEDVKETLMLEKGEYVAREQEARVEVRPAKDELVLGMGPDELADTVGKLRTELGEANRKLLDKEEELHRIETRVVDQANDVLKLENRIEDIQEKIRNTDAQEKAYRDAIDALQKEKAELESTVGSHSKEIEEHKRTIESLNKEMEPYRALALLLRQIIGPGISLEEYEEHIKGVVDKALSNIPKARHRRASSEGDTGIAWIDIWLPKLGPAEAKILRFMAQKFPLQMTKSEVAIGIGLTTSGGYFNGAFNKLRKNKLIVASDGSNFKLAENPP